jgi:hypothetical protein
MCVVRPTPGITRRPERLQIDDNLRVGGRVHALVRRRLGFEIVERDSLPFVPSSQNDAPTDFTTTDNEFVGNLFES